MKLTNLKIGTQLKIAFGIIVLLIIVLGIISWQHADKLAQQTTDLYEHPHTVRRAIGELKADILSMRLEFRNLLLASDEKERQTALQNSEVSQADAERQFDVLYDRYLGPQADVEKAHDTFTRWVTVRAGNREMAQGGKISEAMSRVNDNGDIGKERKQLMDAIKIIDDFAQNKSEQFYVGAVEMKNKLINQLAFLVTAILGLTILITYLLNRNIRRPVAELAAVTRLFREGKMDVRSNYFSTNEFGQLSASFNELADTVETELNLNIQSAKLAGVMLSEDDARQFCHSLLSSLIEHTGAQMGAVYFLNEEKTEFQHFECLGMEPEGCKPFSAVLFEGEFGIALSTQKMQHIANIPEDTRFTFHTVSGKFAPHEIVSIPIVSGNEIVAVISLATIRNFSKNSIRLLHTILGTLSARMGGILAYRKMIDFSQQLEQQNFELDAQQKALAEVSSYTRSLIEASIDPLVTIGPDGHIMDVNRSTESVTGHSRNELVGTDFSDYFTDPERAKAGYQQVFRDGLVRDYELALRHADGHITPVLYNASVYRNENGEVIGVFAAARDISERKHAEQELFNLNQELSFRSKYNRSLIEASVDPLVTIGPDGKIMDVNAATENVTGCTRSKLVGTDFSDYFTDPDLAKAGYQQVFRDGLVRDYELAIHGADGGITPVLYNASVYRDEVGQVIGVFAAARDISERKRVEQEMQILNKELVRRSESLSMVNSELEAQKRELSVQASELIEQNVELEMQKKQLDESNRLKTSFLSNMSHELRTPLNSVIALSGVLNRRLSGKVPDEEYSYLDVIERNGKQLLTLINDILDLSRIEAGREEIEFNRFNARELINEVIELIGPQANQKNIGLSYSDGTDLPPIKTDYVKCRHILQNLVANAVKFTEVGGVEITTKELSESVQITVSDSGIGIDQEYLPYIFDEFRQADGSNSRKYGGTGLGLAIAKKYAEMLGGSIHVESKRGKGSKFMLNLPLQFSTNQVNVERYADQFKLASMSFTGELNTKDKTILLVEDTEAIVIQMKDILVQQGYNIMVARNGSEALEQIEHQIPDAMILDLMMPKVDGFEVLRQIRNQEKTDHLPVIILTAKYVTKEELAFLKHNSIQQIIQKGDINKDQLLNAVARMMFPEAFKAEIPVAKPVRVPVSGTPLVLVVEDNPDNMTTIKALLDGKCEIIEAEDGRSGVDQAKKHRPHLILMDIALPGMNGIEALNEIRKIESIEFVPIIAVSASAMKGDREDFIALGFDDYVSKPIDNRAFQKMLTEYLN